MVEVSLFSTVLNVIQYGAEGHSVRYLIAFSTVLNIPLSEGVLTRMEG